MLQCLLMLLIIFSYYMEREKGLARIFSQVEYLQQQKGFTTRSRQITTKYFLTKKKLVAPVRSNKEPNNIDMNQNVLGQVVSYSRKPEYEIDFEEALKYPLGKIQPSLCHTDGTKQISLKSDLLAALDIQYSPAYVIQDYQQSSFVLDVMAAIVISGNVKMIEELTWKIVNTITAGCKRVDLVAGSYQKAS